MTANLFTRTVTPPKVNLSARYERLSRHRIQCGLRAKKHLATSLLRDYSDQLKSAAGHDVGVDTAVQAWIRDQDPARIGGALHQRFTQSHEAGTLITAAASANVLLMHLPTAATGQIWEPGPAA